MLHVGGHVEHHGEGEMSVDLFFEHGDHVESVPHGIEGQDFGEFLETGALLCPDFLVALRAGVHVVTFKHVDHSDLSQ